MTIDRAAAAYDTVAGTYEDRFVGELGESVRILEPGGRILLSAHEGDGHVEVHDFLGHEVDLGASFFRLDELEEAATAAGLATVKRERRPPYDDEGSTVRLYIEAVRP